MKMPPLHFRQRTFQTVRIGPGVTEVFTDDGTKLGESIGDIKEELLLNWLVGEREARDLLCEVLQRPSDSFIATGVKAPFYGHGEGDIDLIMCAASAPHRAVALECKRVKVEVVDEQNDSVNKLDDVGKGVKQARKLYDKFRFFQTYLVVISAIQGAQRKRLSIPLRGITSNSIPNWDTDRTTFRSIIEFPRREELPPDIGIMFIELVQPSGRRFEDQGTVRICIHHPAAPQEQRPAETNKVQMLVDRTHENQEQGGM